MELIRFAVSMGSACGLAVHVASYAAWARPAASLSVLPRLLHGLCGGPPLSHVLNDPRVLYGVSKSAATFLNDPRVLYGVSKSAATFHKQFID
jgi:hypothetical protein